RLVPDALRISITIDGTVSCFPDVPLSTRSRVIALHELVPILILHHRDDVAVGPATVRPLGLHPATIDEIRVVIVINADDLVIAEVDAVGTHRKDAAVEIRIENLMRERDPSAGRSASEDARPRLADD